MLKPKTVTPLEAVNEIRNDKGQVVMVLQGGGALGAYQGGVYQAMHEAGIEPDWIVGTSIGAINASIIAGNRSEDRLARLLLLRHTDYRYRPRPPGSDLVKGTLSGPPACRQRAGHGERGVGVHRV